MVEPLRNPVGESWPVERLERFEDLGSVKALYLGEPDTKN
jgi:hypothetical protein